MMRVARPIARGLNRFSVGPSSTKTLETKSASGAIPLLFSALAAALLRTLETTLAAPMSEKSRICSAA